MGKSPGWIKMDGKTEEQRIEEEIKNLKCDAVGEQTRAFDFGSGYPEKWDYLEVNVCEECGGIYSSHNPCHRDPETGEEKECKYSDGDSPEGPMMNYLYGFDGPGPDFDEDTASKIKENAMCLVQLDDDYDRVYLALTGGGMDMSWTIAETYILLGYLPPACLRLPKMAGMPLNKGTKLIIAALRRSYEISKTWAGSRIAELENVVEWLREREEIV